MHELRLRFPDPELVPLIQTEELAGIILSILRERGSAQPVHLGNELATLWPSSHSRYGAPITDVWILSRAKTEDDVALALVEAWSWLEGQGLLVSQPSSSTGDWKVLSRKARRIADEASFADYTKARLLPRELLLSALAGTVWLAFMRGEYDAAIFQAFKAVEVAVREASGLGDDLVGTKLMRRAFDPKDGPLTDREAEDGEKESRSALFAGSIGSYKNPQSHRDVNIDNPAEAIELVLLANHLLRIVEVRAVALQRPCISI